MGLSNQDVARRFVDGHKKIATGSNTRYDPPVHANASRLFTSYSTIVAVIKPVTTLGGIVEQLWWMDYRSQSTMRQLSYVHCAWRKRYPDDDIREANTFCVMRPTEGGSDSNTRQYLTLADRELQDMLKPRIREHTRTRHWLQFQSHLRYAEKVMAQPSIYGVTAGSTQELYERLRGVREGANPVGLSPSLEEMVLRVRAIVALQGDAA